MVMPQPSDFPEVGEPLPPIPETTRWMLHDSKKRYRKLLEGMPNSPRLAYWSIRISEIARLWVDKNYPEGLTQGYLAIGYADPARDDVSRKRLALICYTFRDATHPGEQLDEPLYVEKNLCAPIVQRSVIYKPQVNITTQHGVGMGACWVTGGISDVDQGWLTARHVVEDMNGRVIFGEPVFLHEENDAVGGMVIRAAPDAVDAALVHVHPPTHLDQEIQTVSPIMGLEVQYIDQAGRRKVTSIEEFPTFGLNRSSKIPEYFALRSHGGDGDSGTLIRDTRGGDAVGIYTGQMIRYNKLEPDEFEVAGIGLSVEQIKVIMGLRFFL
ncbi:hypothetical protein ACIGPN_20005 [Streptomyces afghaniensis]|uniref:hypothetical protein n=1 Tax=Streptomyces afghaniensis TaxID=66865 RepID=UPI0037D4497E